MVSAPERISIKRRRVDEPVDRLLYQSKKQRTSNHIFVRVQPGATKKQEQLTEISLPDLRHNPKPAPISGIPIVKSTQPGDEVKDFQRYKAFQNLRRDESAVNSIVAPLEATRHAKPPQNARRFHLTRDLSTALRPQSSGGIRKSKSSLRPHLPTFVERYQAAKVHHTSFHAESPIDRVIRSAKLAGHDVDPKQIVENESDVEKQKVQMFQKPSNAAKTGRSIQDDPATWDLESDQLADELAALALEMDPDARSNYLPEPPNVQDQVISVAHPAVKRLEELDEFVYETYIRLQQGKLADLDVITRTKSLGYLVIDEEEEDLWDQYLREDEDDDDEWDEEDEDSNAEDNPRNEYPDEEVSSDDEYGMNVYKYRRNHSEDEQFDENDN
ncbi:hypothetical protein LTR70_000458 [Exophiala xenobiotica]|uniref:Transcription factor Iwr1 domain-containing protein n=1 Tax=Lithohypha guttulata TaxID=1690604 RepID=A0ABR0KRG8_9EURO|nr:hypothetical protein LTR24_000159 [Lithohypha guttulata]KAK5330628.1 hypothetical protein LTR70_000458 [Exophiala xenobiotica]